MQTKRAANGDQLTTVFKNYVSSFLLLIPLTMATMDYVEIPPYATRLASASKSVDKLRPASKILTSLPHPEKLAPTSANRPTSPTSSAFNMLPQLLLSSSLQLPATAQAPTTNTGPRKGPAPLLSARDPLSIPITTVNFRRFVSKSGPVFWFQDRVEEVVMWRRGWQVTGVWMAAYAFICMSSISWHSFCSVF